jgi:hypothetical protein
MSHSVYMQNNHCHRVPTHLQLINIIIIIINRYPNLLVTETNFWTWTCSSLAIRSYQAAITSSSLFERESGHHDATGLVMSISSWTKVKQSSPCNLPWRHRGRAEVQLYSFFNLGARWEGGVSGQRHDPDALLPEKRPGANCTGGWVGGRAGEDGCGKSRPHRDSIPGLPSSQQVAIPTTLTRPRLFHCKYIKLLLQNP